MDSGKTHHSKAQREKIADALAKASGDRGIAAMLLGVSRNKLRDWIHSDPDLKAKYATTVELEVPTEAETLSREPWPDNMPKPAQEDGQNMDAEGFYDPSSAQAMTMELSEEDKQLAAQMAVEDRKLKQGLRALGLNDREVSIATSLQKFHSQQFQHSVEIMTAGVTPLAIKYQTQVNEISRRLELVRKQIHEFGEIHDSARERWLAEEEKLTEALVKVGEQLTKIMKEAYRGMFLIALIKQRKGGASTNDTKVKPGFEPQAPGRGNGNGHE